MPGGSCTVRFYLYDKVKPHPKGLPIYVRITFQRKKARFASGEYCQPDNWNVEAGYPIRAPRIKEYLIFIENKIYDIKRKFDLDGEEVTAAKLRDKFKGKDEQHKIKILDYFDRYINTISKLKEDYSEGTVRHYKTTRIHLHRFLQQEDRLSLSIEDIDLDFVKALDEFFMTTPTSQYNKPMGRNTANKYHTKFKTVLLDAFNKGLIAQNPYNNFTLKNKKVNRTYLTKEELNALNEFDLSFNDSLAKTKDIFLWSCYTGLRFTDAQNLSSNQFFEDEEGQLWLSLQQQKTKEPLQIPLPRRAVDLYHKYEDLRQVTGFVLPRLVNQKVNAYLKVIADLVGINKKLTHHVARHTFATTVLLDNDVPIEVVQSFLGHQSLKTTQIYAKITREKKLNVIKNLNQKL